MTDLFVVINYDSGATYGMERVLMHIDTAVDFKTRQCSMGIHFMSVESDG